MQNFYVPPKQLYPVILGQDAIQNLGLIINEKNRLVKWGKEIVIFYPAGEYQN